METPPPEAPALDYESPLNAQRRSPVRPWLLAVLSLFIAMVAGDAVIDAFRDREWTQDYTQYAVTQTWRARNDASYVAPPFTGRKFVYESPLELRAFYVCIAFGVVGGLGIRTALRRLRRPGHAS